MLPFDGGLDFLDALLGVTGERTNPISHAWQNRDRLSIIRDRLHSDKHKPGAGYTARF
ncbi:hypothetical protein [Oceanobacter mangrovi]|uniref:hypothetical protein n=1 Tax=Oceanobacter mangrovi TaxID=2862510 RepID=UPI001C8D5FA9|nr:hypothetical protein [Oceanobacter mangrovi]